MTHLITPDMNAALLRLWKELEEAALYSGQVAREKGMDSPEFKEADSKTGAITRRIREISSNDGNHHLS
jgi:hypothetical protein